MSSPIEILDTSSPADLAAAEEEMLVGIFKMNFIINNITDSVSNGDAQAAQSGYAEAFKLVARQKFLRQFIEARVEP
jgi:hypothetical protein